jgi:hypothetical protein
MSIMHTCFMHTVQSETQRDKSLWLTYHSS